MDALTITFPPELPICEQRAVVEKAFLAHQVIIVCGETGSGKTTQLPKIALALGRAARGKCIGHTQPRRLAASSVARRIANELKSPLGEVVGFKVRFNDQVSANTRIKLMTDGILLAETQSDPLLSHYDTIIIDEAHERSLNIDFLLGFIRELLPKRPDLKVIITSATIDADRFSRHFSSITGVAPVITVSGRLYPVEIRYLPFEEKNDFDIFDAIVSAVDTLITSPHTAGDMLVFLPGEREIKECESRLSGAILNSHKLRGTEVFALYARLSQNEQEKVFSPHHARRIVLCTNVAETSITVPNIKFVVDAGLARVKRYSYRNKIEQLLVEKISQAAANQRTGRCGRVSDGICARLYSEADFLSRPRFTDPEILRSSLAGVILRMKSLHFGTVETFPFIEMPSGRAIADGYQLLQELGALNEHNELTTSGREVARLPVDPRIAKMLLSARDNGSLAEVLIVAASLSLQDVRERPMNEQAAADKAHAKFDDEKSEFSGLLRLWNWLLEARRDAPSGDQSEADEASKTQGRHKLSNRQYEKLLRDHFISLRRVREWRDIHSQLCTVIKEQRWHINQSPATYEQFHLAILSGLLGNIGCKWDEGTGGEYLGARAIKFFVHPGAHLRKKPGKWIMAQELVETHKLYARTLATIEPQWLERAGEHLIKKQLIDPHWSKKSGEVVALERATLYGLVIYNGRRMNYGRVDPQGARAIFIRQALVGDDIDSTLSFLEHNRKLIGKVEELEHKSRRQDVLVDDELIYHFYDQQLPDEVCSTHSLEHWYRHAVKADKSLLQLSKEALMRHEAAGITTNSYPKYIRFGGVDCYADYLHQPGDAKDGVTVTLPLYVLNQASEYRPDWLVPGMLKEKVLAMVKTLHQRVRSRLVPINATVDQFCMALSLDTKFGSGDLLEAIIQLIRETTGLSLSKADFRLDSLQPHHFMNFILVDEFGRHLTQSRNLMQLKTQHSKDARGAFQSLAALKNTAIKADEPIQPAQPNQTDPPALENGSPAGAQVGTPLLTQEKYHDWTFGELPELLEIKRGKQSLIGYPALIDKIEHVVIEVFDEPDMAAHKHKKGLSRLMSFQLKDALKYLEKNIPDLQKMSLNFMQVGSLESGKASGGTMEELRTMVINLAIERAFLIAPLPINHDEFKERLKEGRSRVNLIAIEIARQAGVVLAEYTATLKKIKEAKISPESLKNIKEQLTRLVKKDFLQSIPWQQLQHVPRYLKAIQMRLDKYRLDPARDLARQKEFEPLEARYWRRLLELKGNADERMQDYRWLLEELRVGLFAQELKTPQPVSSKRLDKAWAQVVL